MKGIRRSECRLFLMYREGAPAFLQVGAPSAALVHASKEEMVKRLLLRLAVGLIGLAVVAKGMAQPPPPWSVLTDLGATAEQRVRFNRDAPRLIDQALKDQRKLLLIREAALADPQPTGRIAEELELWFLGKDASTREAVLSGVTKLLDLNAKAQLRLAKGESVFVPNDDMVKGGFWAQVDPKNKERFYLGKAFFGAPRTGRDTQAGILTYVTALAGGLADAGKAVPGKRAVRMVNLPSSAGARRLSAEVWQYFVESAAWETKSPGEPTDLALKGAASIEVKPWDSLLGPTASDKDKADFDKKAPETIRKGMVDALKELKDRQDALSKWDDPNVRQSF